MESSRLRELDALRGLAALAIVVHHNLLASNLLSGPLQGLLFASPLQSLTRGRQAVLFFFVLSGFVLTRSLASLDGKVTVSRWFGWALQRSIRLLLPVTAAILISALLYRVFYAGRWDGESSWLVDFFWQAPPSLTSVVQQALLSRSAYHYELDNVVWSLAHEWRLSILLPVVALFATLRGKQAAALILLIGLATAGVVAGASGADQNLNPGLLGSIRSSLYFVLPFAIGAAMHRANVVELRPGPALYAVGVVAAAALARMDDDITDYCASAILIWLAVQPGILQGLLLSPALQWIGKLSFSIYLVHELVLAPIHHALHPVLGPVVLFGLSCLAAIPASYLFYLVIEKRAHLLARMAWSRFRGETRPASARTQVAELGRATPGPGMS